MYQILFYDTAEWTNILCSWNTEHYVITSWNDKMYSDHKWGGETDI